MTKTPWNWIITAFILAILFLVSFGFYRNETKYNKYSEVDRLKKELLEKDNEIGRLNNDLNAERKKKPTSTPPQQSSEEIKNLKKIIDSKENTINKQNKSIRTLNDSISKLQRKLDYFISAPK